MKYALVLNAPTLDVEIEESLVVAADGGFRLVEDRPVQVVIGDFDTLGYIPDSVLTVSHPVDKDKTDGELALDYVNNIGGEAVTIYGASGGHTDHVLGNVNLLAYANKIGLQAKIKNRNEEIYFVSASFKKNVDVGDVVSVIPFGGKVSFLKSQGLYYNLNDVTVEPYSSLGLSNKAVANEISIEVEEGNCLVIVRKISK